MYLVVTCSRFREQGTLSNGCLPVFHVTKQLSLAGAGQLWSTGDEKTSSGWPELPWRDKARTGQWCMPAIMVTNGQSYTELL